MLGIIAAIVSTISFSFLALIYKKLREKGVGPMAIMGLGAICVPVWIFIGYLVWLNGDAPQLSRSYLASLLIWIIGVSILSWGGKYLYAYRNLTELKAYGLAIGLLTGLGADLFFIKTVLNPFSVISAFLLLVGGI